MHSRPELYAEGLLALARGEQSVEAHAAAIRLATCLLMLEHAHTAKKGASRRG